MDTPVLVALISGALALIVPAVSLVGSLITSRRAERSAVELERLKQSGATMERDWAFIDAELRDTLGALKRDIQATQSMKDVIQLVLSASGTSLSSEVATSKIDMAWEQMNEAMKHGCPHLSRQQHKALDEAKNLALLSMRVLRDSVRRRIFVDLSNSKEAADLRDFRERLEPSTRLAVSAVQLGLYLPLLNVAYVESVRRS